MSSKYTNMMELDHGKVNSVTYCCESCGCDFSVSDDFDIAYCPICGKEVDVVYTEEEYQEWQEELEKEQAQYEADIASAWNEAKGFI